MINSTRLQPILPHHLISKLVALLCYCRWKWFKNWSIRRFIRIYGVNLAEAENSKIEDYIHLNAFFTRKIRQDIRPLSLGEKNIICPVDGSLSQFGSIQQKSLIQAKGFNYDLAALLAHNAHLVDSFSRGTFMTLYLAPHDYHRIHMPITGQLQSMTYVPGRLFSVNNDSTQTIPNLFTRNERVINIFNTAAGPMAVILIGAMIVGSMETVWAGRISAKQARKMYSIDYPQQGELAVQLTQGAELGHFNFGSTVILLFGPHALKWHDKCVLNATMRMGELIAHC